MYEYVYFDLEGIMLNEINEPEKDKCCMILLISRIKFKTNKQTQNSQKKRSDLCLQEESGWEMESEETTKRYK